MLAGDGKLPHPGDEFITEGCYDLTARKGIAVALDYRFVANPGDNRGRGPAHVFGMRLRGQF